MMTEINHAYFIVTYENPTFLDNDLPSLTGPVLRSFVQTTVKLPDLPTVEQNLDQILALLELSNLSQVISVEKLDDPMQIIELADIIQKEIDQKQMIAQAQPVTLSESGQLHQTNKDHAPLTEHQDELNHTQTNSKEKQ
jgi:hypothetical protein